MSKHIIFSNQKGGVGKTTMAMLFANYLTLFEKKEVHCFDFDEQKAFYELYLADTQRTNTKPLYEVAKFEPSQAADTIKQVNEYEGTFIYDLPGFLNDDLMPLYLNCDIVVCPFHYDKHNTGPTLYFAKIMDYLNKNTEANFKLYFLPNQIDKRVNYNSNKRQDSGFDLPGFLENLKKYGEILPEFKLSDALKTVDVFTIPSKLNHSVSKSFEPIFKENFLK